MLHINARTLEFSGRGYFALLFFSQKANVSSGINLKTWKYNVCSIKLETKVIRLYKNSGLEDFIAIKNAVHVS